ncbi:MAG TPA: hypothetical protein VGK64_14225 [Bryobacteraceae bacterium]
MFNLATTISTVVSAEGDISSGWGAKARFAGDGKVRAPSPVSLLAAHATYEGESLSSTDKNINYLEAYYEYSTTSQPDSCEAYQDK